VWISQRLSAAEYAAFDYQPEPLRAPVAGVTWTMAQLPAKVVMVLALNLRRSRNVWASIRRRLVG
jgi:hypothetical protein